MTKKEIEWFGQFFSDTEISESAKRRVFYEFPKIQEEAESWDEYNSIEEWAEREVSDRMFALHGNLWPVRKDKADYNRVYAEVELERKQRLGLI